VPDGNATEKTFALKDEEFFPTLFSG